MGRCSNRIAGLLTLIELGGSASAAAQGPVAYLIAPSSSTRAEATRLLWVGGGGDTTVVRDADLVLVVVRSSGSFPLASSYDSLKWLQDAASSQMNDSGAQFHIYLFTIRSDITFLQSSHSSYDVKSGGATALPSEVSPSLHPSRVLYPCGLTPASSSASQGTADSAPR
jgi:hypothetical protein